MTPTKVVVEIHGGFAIVVEKPRGVEVVLVDFDGVGDEPDVLDHPAGEEILEGLLVREVPNFDPEHPRQVVQEQEGRVLDPGLEVDDVDAVYLGLLSQDGLGETALMPPDPKASAESLEKSLVLPEGPTHG